MFGTRSLVQCLGRIARTQQTVVLRSLMSTQAPAVQEGVHSKNLDALQAAMVERDVIEGAQTSLLFSIPDQPGTLNKTLAIFAKHGLNMCHIESRPTKGHTKAYDFAADVDASPSDPKVVRMMEELRTVCLGVTIPAPKVVPWFPTRIAEIDRFSTKTLDAGTDLEADHPGFNDPEYRARRKFIVETAQSYRTGEKIPRIQYNQKEIETWGTVYSRLGHYTKHYAIDTYNHIIPLLEQNCGYGVNNIPQLQDISDFLKDCTGFTLRPVGGLLSARDFLNALAFRVFFSTQYIRHHATPLYTPEPDVVHELMGHAPMLADPDFADFSQEVGLASLGASDDDIKKLATCYWFSVEFGLVREKGKYKAYGAGLLSSFGELEFSCAPHRPAGGEDHFPEYLPWNPEKAAVTPYPITCYQPAYFVAESLADAKEKMREYCAKMNKGFHVKWDPLSQTVSVDRAIARGAYTITLQK